jgi:hypothetical protein
MIWNLAQDHTPNTPDPLLQAIKQSIAAPGLTSLQTNGSDIVLNFTGIALGSYRVQWSSNLAVWNTLLITNVAGPGGLMQISDPGAVSNGTARFYRVQTPP